MTEQICQCEDPSVDSSVVGSSSVSFCSTCGAELFATTQLPAIETDNTSYSIFLMGRHEMSVEQLKAIASAASLNLLQAKDLVSDEQKTMIFEGRAAAVQKHRKELLAVEVEFVIEPDFPHGLDAETDTVFFS